MWVGRMGVTVIVAVVRRMFMVVMIMGLILRL
jgi:hypothetical protein